MGQYENDGSVTVNIAKVMLMLINMAFLVGGGLLVFFSQRVKKSGWLDAFEGDYAWVGSTTILFILVLGAVVMALAALGCFGAWFRNRIVLTIYAVVLIIAAGLFIVVAVGGSSVKSKAKDWEAATFPADSDESAVGNNFNQLYCLAQVPDYCQTKTASEIASLFSLNVPEVVTSVAGTYTLTQLCTMSSKPAQFEQLCEVCSLVVKYASYTPVVEWAKDSCKQTPSNQIWCGKFLIEKGSGSGNFSSANVFSNGAPYSECRTSFLDLVIKWSNFLFASALIVSISTIAVFGFACLVRQGTNRPYLDDSFVVDSPDRN